MLRNFDNAPIVTNDETDDEKCADEGAKGQILASKFAENIKRDLFAMNQRLGLEQKRFLAYQALNSVMENKSGQVDTSSQLLLRQNGSSSDTSAEMVGGERNKADISGTEKLKQEKK